MASHAHGVDTFPYDRRGLHKFAMAELSLAMHKQFTTRCWAKGLFSLPVVIVFALALRRSRASSSIRRRSVKREQGLSLPYQLNV